MHRCDRVAEIGRMSTATPFSGLDPQAVLEAVESLGLQTDGRLFALNSYENRVYRLGLEQPLADQGFSAADVQLDAVVVKFYRPQRWSDAQILEEHAFALELAQAQLPVAAPVRCEGQTLHDSDGFRFALFECCRGGAPELDAAGARELLGRTLGRIHAQGSRWPFDERESWVDSEWGQRARRTVLDLGVVPQPVRASYQQVSGQLADAIAAQVGSTDNWRQLRLHGDCHLGNILWNARGPVIVDLDDCIQGPAIHDLWMFLSGGSPATQQAEWAQLMAGYEQFADFDYNEVALIEPLRGLRMLNHAAWLASRWTDPAFPKAFPWFAEARYWERHVADLREQLEALADPPLLRSC